MGRVGFIQDKLEIKFLILYVAARLIEPVPFEAMQELAMIDDGVDFFDFSECMNDLVTSGHLTLSEDGLYAITEKGLRNGQICESSLPYSVRLAADKNITVFNQKLRRRADNIQLLFVCLHTIPLCLLWLFICYSSLFAMALFCFAHAAPCNSGSRVATLVVSTGVMGFLGDLREDRSRARPVGGSARRSIPSEREQPCCDL
mgnify:CR=1 FL=1